MLPRYEMKMVDLPHDPNAFGLPADGRGIYTDGDREGGYVQETLVKGGRPFHWSIVLPDLMAVN